MSPTSTFNLNSAESAAVVITLLVMIQQSIAMGGAYRLATSERYTFCKFCCCDKYFYTKQYSYQEDNHVDTINLMQSWVIHSKHDTSHLYHRAIYEIDLTCGYLSYERKLTILPSSEHASRTNRSAHPSEPHGAAVVFRVCMNVAMHRMNLSWRAV